MNYNDKVRGDPGFYYVRRIFMEWYSVKVYTSSEAVEAVSYHLSEVLGAQGIQIEDPSDITNADPKEGQWDYFDVESASYDHEDPVVIGFFETDDVEALKTTILAYCDQLESFGLNPGTPKVEYSIIVEDEWRNAWKKYFKPFKVGDNIVVKPSWEHYDEEEGDILVEIDPGNAFGSGTHETTSMCIEFLQKYLKEGMDVYDVGCGSGILGITAAKLGARAVTGIEIDEDASITARENTVFNHVDDKMTVLCGDLLSQVSKPVDMVVANIIADVIMMMSADVRTVLKDKGLFIASGILAERLEEVKSALVDEGYTIIEDRTSGEWSALVANK